MTVAEFVSCIHPKHATDKGKAEKRGETYKPKRAEPGLMLCQRHVDTIRYDLADIELLYALLDDVIEPGSVQSDELVRYQKRLEPPVPLRLEVVTLRDKRTHTDPRHDAIAVLAILDSWLRVVLEERQLTTAADTLTAVISLLNRHAEWIAAQPFADDYASEVHTAATALRHVCGEYDHQHSVGKCPVLDCDGLLYADRYGAMAVTCRACGEHWGETELRRLGLVIGA
jgi:hypothetical protein